MGCGKSSVGRELSQLLCCPFMDLDQVIEEREGRSIPEIFSRDGEPECRRIELEALKHIVGRGGSKTKSLPRLRRGPLPFTRPRAAMVFKPYLWSYYTLLVVCCKKAEAFFEHVELLRTVELGHADSHAPLAASGQRQGDGANDIEHKFTHKGGRV